MAWAAGSGNTSCIFIPPSVLSRKGKRGMLDGTGERGFFVLCLSINKVHLIIRSFVVVLSFVLIQKKERKKKSSAKERLRPFARHARRVSLD